MIAFSRNLSGPGDHEVMKSATFGQKKQFLVTKFIGAVEPGIGPIALPLQRRGGDGL